jgi:predicted transcriptional regulator of viral defense system
MEFVSANPGRAVATVDRTLTRWHAEGRVEQVKRGLYVRLDRGGGLLPDFALVAARMAPDAAAAYHTALEVHGCAQSLVERFTFVTWSKVKPLVWRRRGILPVRPRRALEKDQGEPWIEVRERSGQTLRVTSIERTVVDVLDRPHLAGGIEEVWRSLDSVPAIDPVSLLEYVLRLEDPKIAARVGYYVDSRRDELAVPAVTLEALRVMLPSRPVFMDRRLGGSLDERWRVIVPDEFSDPHEDIEA